LEVKVKVKEAAAFLASTERPTSADDLATFARWIW
jgi:hypothetical protein